MAGTEDDDETLIQAIRAIWARSFESTLARVHQLESTAAILRDSGSLDLGTTRAAEVEAHKLAGMFGSFGFDAASGLAREIELRLQKGEALDARDGADIVRLARAVAERLTPMP